MKLHLIPSHADWFTIVDVLQFMFPRALRTLHICLRCQSTKQSLKPFSYVRHARRQKHQGTTCRWNSSTALLREERDGDNDNVELHAQVVRLPDLRSETTLASKDVPQLATQADLDDSPLEVEAIDSHSHRDGSEEPRPTLSPKYRHWRPPTTAALDRNFLGQPGEILVLPETRRQKRRHQTASHDEEDQENNGSSTVKKESKRKSIYETLTSENTPMSKDEIIKSIDEVRSTLPPAESHGSQAAPARRLLEKSFSKNQLNIYIQNSTSKTTKSLASSSRADLAAHIIQNVWCLEVQEKGWNISLLKPLKQLIHLVKHHHPSKLDFRTVTESRDGFRGINPVAQAKLEKLAREGFVTKVFSQPKITDLPNNKFVRSWINHKIEALARENMIILQNKDSKKLSDFKAYAFSKPSLLNFARELSLLYQSIEPFAHSIQSIDSNIKGIFLPVVDRGNLVDGEKSFRSKQPRTNQDPDHTEIAESLRTKLQDKLLTPVSNMVDHLGSMIDPSLRNQVSTRFCAEFGKLGVSYLDIANPDGITRETFSTNVPLLPQFLADQDQPGPGNPVMQAATHPSLSRLLFKPGGQMSLPSVEIYADLSKSESILIRQISLQFNPTMETVPLPRQATDIRLSRHDSLLLFDSDKPMEERFGPLIGSIAEQLPFAHQPANMYNPGNLNISYSMNLDTTFLTSPDQSDEGKNSVHYVLETAQTVQNIAYTDSDTAVLERVSYAPAFKSLLSDSVQRVQTLRLTDKHKSSSQQSTSSDSESDTKIVDESKQRFESFLRDAYQIASKISGFATAETRKLVARYPGFD